LRGLDVNQRPLNFRLDLRLALENLNREMGIESSQVLEGGAANFLGNSTNCP